MGPFLKVKPLRDECYEFLCPHCKHVVIAYEADRNEHIPLPSKCQKCNGTIDPKGVELYKEE